MMHISKILLFIEDHERWRRSIGFDFTFNDGKIMAFRTSDRALEFVRCVRVCEVWKYNSRYSSNTLIVTTKFSNTQVHVCTVILVMSPREFVTSSEFFLRNTWLAHHLRVVKMMV